MDQNGGSVKSLIRAITETATRLGLDPAEVLAGLDPAQSGLSPEAEALLARMLDLLAAGPPSRCPKDD